MSFSDIIKYIPDKDGNFCGEDTLIINGFGDSYSIFRIPNTSDLRTVCEADKRAGLTVPAVFIGVDHNKIDPILTEILEELENGGKPPLAIEGFTTIQ